MVMRLKESFNSSTFGDILKRINIDFHEFSLNKCDERTFYISIIIKNGKEKEICDLIFLLDRPDVLGAISLNEKYDNVRNFFKRHFNYDLSYSDEQKIAKLIMKTVHFKQCLRKFSALYPKHISNTQ